MRSVVSNKHAAAHHNARALACMELENIYQKVLVFVFKRTWGTAPASGPGSCFTHECECCAFVKHKRAEPTILVQSAAPVA